MSVTVRNPTQGIAFFTQLKLQYPDGTNISPAFYSDNFFSLLPGEAKKVEIELPPSANGKAVTLITGAFNSAEIRSKIKVSND